MKSGKGMQKERYSTVVYMVFFAKSTYLGRTGLTSFCMQFKKVGRGLLRGGKRRERESGLCGSKRGGMKREYRS